MLTIRDSQMQVIGNSRPNTQVVQCCANDPHWIEFQLLDQDDNPVPGEPYKVILPDKSVFMGMLDNEGKVRFDSIIAGQAIICFTGMDGKQWWSL